MAKQSRLKKEYRSNASKLHKAVGDMLHASPIFSNYRIYQEYPVNMISPYFDSGREKFDWVIMDLMVVIEAHGQQHYQPVCFGGIPKEEAKQKYKEQVIRDLKKKLAAQKAGWTYVVFKYNKKDINVSALMAKITYENDRKEVTQDRNTVHQQVKQKKRPKREDDSYHKEQLRRAKEYRKQQYKKHKERQDADKRRKK
jgi:hypothetical protein